MLIGLLFACAKEDQEYPFVSNIEIVVEITGSPNDDRPNGDAFVLQSADVVLYSIRFPECEEFTRAVSWFIPAAYAGHSDINIPSNLNKPTVLDLLEPAEIVYQYAIPEQTICFAATTFARWDGSTSNLPDNIIPEEPFSIRIQGDCSNSDAEELNFDIQTAIPSERIEAVPTQIEHEMFDTLKYTIVFDTTDMLSQIKCRPETFSDENASGLQVLTNLQNNALRSLEWE